MWNQFAAEPVRCREHLHPLHHAFTSPADPEDIDRKETEMNNRRVWAGVVAGVLAAMVVVSVAVGAYQAGERRSEPVTQVVGDGGGVVGVGGVVRVVGGHGWGYGPGPGFFLFPLLGIVLVVLLLRGRGGPGGWHRGCGPGGGYGGYGYGGREEALQDWHRRAHGDAATPPTGADPSPAREV
jgi:hypothetical protein